MCALRALSLTIATALILTAPAEAQRRWPALGNDLRDVEIQKALIASGTLDAQAGRASRVQLRDAIKWFRKAHKFADNLEPLTPGERQKLAELRSAFNARTGFTPEKHKDPNTGVSLRLPTAFVGKEAKKKQEGDKTWWEYHSAENSVSIGPESHSLADYTPIALFRERIMNAAPKYTHLHLTSDEFTAEGGVGGADGYFSYNLVLTSGDRLKGVFMRYAKQPPADFQVPDFLVPIVAAQPSASDAPQLDKRTRGWQLLMQGITNLAASDFPFDNDWKQVSSKDCPLTKDPPEGQPKKIRVLFGTDRKIKEGVSPKGPVPDPDSLFINEADNQLHLGCAYVLVPSTKQVTAASDLRKLYTIEEHRFIHDTGKADIGDHLYLTDEIGRIRDKEIVRKESKDSRGTTGKGRDRQGADRTSALVFIHGYNVAFADALFTVANIASATDYQGRVYMYSWPSAYSALRYVQDMDNAEQAEPFLQSFMKLLMRDADIDEIDIVVHSMGSQAVLRALSALRAVFETERPGRGQAKSIRIGQIIFAAPDVAMPIFDQKIRRIAPYADRVTVYVSSTDAALFASKFLRGGAPRMGELKDNKDNSKEPLLIDLDNVHLIDATGKERWYRVFIGGFGHDYFTQAKAVVDDIQTILASKGEDDTKEPDQRSSTRFTKVPFAENPKRFFWRLNEK